MTTAYSEEALSAFAHTLARELRGGMTIALCGPLGAGKTTFVRALAQALGSRDPVSSPTYVLQHEYRTASDLLIEHWDLYRLSEAAEELREPAGPHTIRLIEWPEKAPEVLHDADLVISLSPTGKDGELRNLTLERRPPR